MVLPKLNNEVTKKEGLALQNHYFEANKKLGKAMILHKLGSEPFAR
jgi:hypothetical protein